MSEAIEDTDPARQLAEPLRRAIGERYLQYALSTIMHRALPDARDGLKPVHRRILYAMRELRLSSSGGFRKSAKISGDVMGNYHPHGDAAIYDALSPLWSVALEMQFYVAIALIVMLMGRKGFWLIPVLALLVTGNRVLEENFSSIRTHLRVDEILAGCLLALVWVNRDLPIAARAGRVMAVGFWAFVVLWARSCWPPSGALGYLRPYLGAAMVGGVLFGRETWVHRMLSTRVLAYIAAISFALYVWHSPFRFGWFDPEETWRKYLIARPLGLAATFAIAHVSTFYFELVINSWAKKISRKSGKVAEA